MPLHLLNIFTADELKHLIGGVQIIDIDDWQNNTEYGKGLDRNSQVVRWFWNVSSKFINALHFKFQLYSKILSANSAISFIYIVNVLQVVLQFTNEQRHRLLQFVVGSFIVPANGFKNLLPKFRIELDYDVSDDRIPRVSSWYVHNITRNKNYSFNCSNNYFPISALIPYFYFSIRMKT